MLRCYSSPTWSTLEPGAAVWAAHGSAICAAFHPGPEMFCCVQRKSWLQARWLQDKGLAQKAWAAAFDGFGSTAPETLCLWSEVRRFPEVLGGVPRAPLLYTTYIGTAASHFPGLSVEDLEEGRSTAPSYLKSEDTYNKARGRRKYGCAAPLIESLKFRAEVPGHQVQPNAARKAPRSKIRVP